MSKVILYKEVEFAAAHRLYNDKLTEQENLDLYAKCTIDHGHNYKLVLGIEGDVDPLTGMVMNSKDVKDLLEENILSKCDHQHLNDIEGLKNKVPTVENLVLWIWEVLSPHFPEGQLKEIILYETDRTFAKYRAS